VVDEHLLQTRRGGQARKLLARNLEQPGEEQGEYHRPTVTECARAGVDGLLSGGRTLLKQMSPSAPVKFRPSMISDSRISFTH
jgi:hypothetical protein